MNIKLINKPNKDFNTITQILFNRGIPKDKIQNYLNVSHKDVNDYNLLGEDNLKNAATILINNIQALKKVLVVIDSDADGYTSAALLINYLNELFPYWVENCLQWIVHSGKQHGLSDHVDNIISEQYSLVICPDSSSNDYQEHKKLKENNINVLVIDHHLVDHVSEDAIIINNQLSDYPNKELSGVGVVWQFCNYIDNLLGVAYADKFLDLVALGLSADMMSLTSFETRYLISKGFQKQNIKNPFIDYMLDKNSFPLSKTEYKSALPDAACTNIGAAFFITPFLNAISRSGSLSEKQLIFESMLNHRAFVQIPEIKRNKKTGKYEPLVLQAVRVIGNVKNRQTKAENTGLEKVENLIKKQNLLKHKMILILTKPGEIDNNIKGLIANKIMAKYQKPCAILSENEELFEGSGRGYTKTGLTSLKAVLETAPGVVYCEGHDNAHGLGIKKDMITEFIDYMDNVLQDLPSEPEYLVDYYFTDTNEETCKRILDIAKMNDFWGQDIDRSHVAIKFRITKDNFSVLKSNTLKIQLPNLSIIKFGSTDEEIENFTTQGFIDIEAYCQCAINSWNDKDYPQLFLKDYNILNKGKYLF